jgi:hypothetical protein
MASACTVLVDRELDGFEEDVPSDEATTRDTSGPAGQGASGTGASGQGGSGAAATGVGAGGSGGERCGTVPEPPVDPCPKACSGGCDGAVCRIACLGEQACKELTIACPAGWPCELTCGKMGCEKATVLCPSDAPCTLRCSAEKACHDARAIATQGVTEVECSSAVDVCKGFEIDCGANACGALCQGASKPKLNCQQSCECAPC